MIPFLRRTVLAIQRRQLGFGPALAAGAGDDDPPLPPPIFLVGAPRTGSTVFAQALLGAYRLGYISNLMALVPRHMVRIGRLVPGSAGPLRSGIRDSRWGYVPGLRAPNEAGAVMGFWFGEASSSRHDDKVRGTVRVLSSLVGGPIFFKNQSNTLRIPRILEIFPHARFVLLRRNPLLTAQSILQVRQAIHGDAGTWWSVRPPNCPGDGADPCQEVLCQVHELERIGGATASLGQERFCEVWYEDFCREPARVLDALAGRFELAPRADGPPLPGSLPLSDKVRVDTRTWERLEALERGYRAGGDGAPRLSGKGEPGQPFGPARNPRHGVGG